MGDGKCAKSMIEKSECHVVISKFDVVLCNFDENVGSTVMTVSKGQLVMHECAAMIV